MKKFISFILMMITIILATGCSGSCKTPEKLTVNLLSPSTNQDNISTSVNFLLQFNTAVTGVNTKNLSISASNNKSTNLNLTAETSQNVAIRSIVAGANNTYNVTTTGNLNPNTTYYLVLNENITTQTGLVKLKPVAFPITTGSSNAPTAVVLSVTDGIGNVSKNTALQVQFSESVANVNTQNVQVIEQSSNTPAKISTITAGDYNTYNIIVESQLTDSTTYSINIGGSIISNQSGANISPTTITFTTGTSVTPTVTMVSPTANAESVSLTPTLQIQFSSPVANINNSNITITDQNNNSIAISSITKGNNNVYTITLANKLTAKSTYKVQVGSGITDNSPDSNTITPTAFEFTTGEFTAPTVSLLSPSNNESNVNLSTSISIQFSSVIQNVNTSTVSILANDPVNGTPVTVESIKAGHNNTYLITTQSVLDSNTTYYVVLSNAILDAAGNNNLQSNNLFYFTTGDFMAPTVNMLAPSDNAQDVMLQPTVQIQFSESVTNVTSANISLHKDSPAGESVAINAIYLDTNNTYNINFSSALEKNTKYYLMLGNGITDKSGNLNQLVAKAFLFTTGNFTIPTVSLLSPNNNAQDVMLLPAIQIQFSTAVTNVNTSNVVLHTGSPSGPSVAINSIDSNSNNTYNINLSAMLEINTNYYLTLESGITGVSGNQSQLAPSVFNFYTGIINSTIALVTITPTVAINSRVNGLNITPNGKYMYMANENGNIYQYALNKGIPGLLTPNSVSQPRGTQANQNIINPTGDFVFSAQGHGPYKYEYTIDQATGQLSLIQNITNPNGSNSGFPNRQAYTSFGAYQYTFFSSTTADGPPWNGIEGMVINTSGELSFSAIQFKLPAEPFDLQYYNGYFYVMLVDGTIYSLQLLDGATSNPLRNLTKIATMSNCNSPGNLFIVGNNLFATCAQPTSGAPNVYSYQIQPDTSLVQRDSLTLNNAGNSQWSTISQDGKYLFMAGQNGYLSLIALNQATGSLTSYGAINFLAGATGSAPSGVMTYGGNLYVSDIAGNILTYKLY